MADQKPSAETALVPVQENHPMDAVATEAAKTDAPPPEARAEDAPKPEGAPEDKAEGEAQQEAAPKPEKPKPQLISRIAFRKPLQSFHKVVPDILLRGCQVDAIDAFRESQARRKIIVLPTGTGKTITAMTLAAENESGRTLWLAHRDELIEQPYAEVGKSFKGGRADGLEVGIMKAGQNDCGARLVIGSVQTVCRERRLLSLQEESPFSLVIVDECHHTPGKQYQRILDVLGCFDPGGPQVLGLTATPKRADKISLGTTYEEVVYTLTIAEAIAEGWLVKPVWKHIPLALDERSLRVVHNEFGEEDYNQTDLEKAWARAEGNRKTAIAVKEYANGRKTVVFTVSVDDAKAMAEEFKKIGVKAGWVSGAPYMSSADRKAMIEKFAKREIDVLCNSQLLCEGWDDKTVDCVVVAKPTKSQGALAQMVGRGLRMAKDKIDCLVLGIVGEKVFDMLTIDKYLKQTNERVVPKRRRRRSDLPVDPDAAWKRICAYLRAAKQLDAIWHGATEFARVSDDVLVTVTGDGGMIVVRRTDLQENLWVIEREGIQRTTPGELHDRLTAANNLAQHEYGGSVHPGSKEWKAAADKGVQDAAPPLTPGS